MKFRRVAGQIADEVLEGSGTHSKQSSGRVRVQKHSKIFQAVGDNTWVYFK